jgi:hypothetical protein
MQIGEGYSKILVITAKTISRVGRRKETPYGRGHSDILEPPHPSPPIIVRMRSSLLLWVKLCQKFGRTKQGDLQTSVLMGFRVLFVDNFAAASCLNRL